MRDPIVTEIMMNALTTIAEEMSITVVRSGYSSFIKEGADASSAILDVQGRLITQSVGTLLLHMSSLRVSLTELLKDYPPDTMKEGDVYLMNDPARGGIHANDIEVFRPVFVDGRVVFFTASLIHVADLGGVSAGGLPAQATEIFHEGILLPPVPVYQQGVANEVVTKIIELNSRTPEKVMGDIRALVAACNVGAKRLDELIARHGYPALHEVIEDLLDYTERRTRQEIEALPEGVFTGDFTIDDDGIDPAKEYHVRVRLERQGADLVVDFTGTDPQAQGPINAAFSQALTGVVYAARCFLDPTIPMNEGTYRPLKVHLPEGTLVHPHPSAALNARIVTVTAIIESMLQALSKQRPERAVAGCGINHVYTMNGRTPDGRVWIIMDNDFGGVGARATKDGVDATGPFLFGGRSNVIQLEPLEAEFPVVFERYALAKDSGGPGTWRGGLAVDRTVRVQTPAEISVRSDRMRFPPPGRFGGRPGAPGAWVVNGGRPDEQQLGTKQMGVRLKAGDTLTMLTSGGGGFGPPWQRDLELVRADVIAGRVSVEAAARDYGVVFHPETDRVDGAATARRRAEMAAAAGEVRA